MPNIKGAESDVASTEVIHSVQWLRAECLSHMLIGLLKWAEDTWELQSAPTDIDTARSEQP